MDTQLPPHFTKAFKSADIRGVHLTEIDDDLAYQVARALVDEFGYREVLVAHDMRISSPALVEAFVKGLVDAGAVAVPLGLASSPMFYYASAHKQLPGVMITASHNPPNYNGLKLVHPGAVPFTTRHGLSALARRVARGRYTEPARPGRVRPLDVRAGYARYVLKGWPSKRMAGLSIAADLGNGMASVVLPLVAPKLPINFTTLFADLDGRFPNRGSDPTLKRHQRHLRAKLAEGGFDLGIAFDGDADRIAFLDERGTAVNSAIIAAIVAQEFLRHEPGARIATTILTSRILPEVTKECGGVPVWAKDGHAFVKDTMRTRDAVFGAEYSGHFYFRDFFYTDSVMLTLRYVLEAYATVKQQGGAFSDLVRPFARYVQLEDTVIPVDNPTRVMTAVMTYLKARQPKSLRRFDGLSFDFGPAWGAVKPSVTEPVIKVICESTRKSDAVALQAELVGYIETIANE